MIGYCIPRSVNKAHVLRTSAVLFLCLSIYSLAQTSNETFRNLRDALPSITFEQLIKMSLSQDDQILIEYLQSSGLVVPPNMTATYNLDFPLTKDFSEGNFSVLLQYIFKNKSHGTFFEAGAFDGERHSTTLALERDYKWTGVLLEPSPLLQPSILEKNRKATLVRSCLSIEPKATQVKFVDTGTMLGRIQNASEEIQTKADSFCPVVNIMLFNKTLNATESERLKRESCKMLVEVSNLVDVPCFPLYTVLLATNLTKLDFLSIDTEGAEYKIMATVPFDKLDVKLIRVEITLLNRNDRDKLIQLMMSYGYRLLHQYGHFDLDEIKTDYFFMKKKNYILDWLLPQ